MCIRDRDTAAPGEVPAGVNDFAIHPSMKLMVTVGRGEKSMRLWNLVTGKKAGVLSFDRDLLAQVGEGRYGSGEGRRVLWTESGEDFVVGFERGAVVFGMVSLEYILIVWAVSHCRLGLQTQGCYQNHPTDQDTSAALPASGVLWRARRRISTINRRRSHNLLRHRQSSSN